MANNIFQSFKNSIGEIGNLFSRVGDNAKNLGLYTKSTKDLASEGLRSIPIYFESNIVRPISNNLGQQVAKVAGINNANPERGLRNTISDISNRMQFNYENSPGQNNGLLSPRGWKAPQGALRYDSLPQQTQITQPTPTPTVNKITEIPGFKRNGSGIEYYDTIINASKANNVNPAVLAGLLFQESGIKPNAINESIIKDKKGNEIKTVDRGIAQINNYYHPDVTDEQANDPNFAIPWAAKYLADKLKYFDNDINRALASYNVGQSGAEIKGPEVFGGGPRGQLYLNRLSQNFNDELLSQLGIKTGPIVSAPETYMTKKELDEYYKNKKGK